MATKKSTAVVSVHFASDKSAQVLPYSLLTEYDIGLFQGGKHFRLYDKLGAHIIKDDVNDGTYFAVWAPNAQKVSVMADFNEWHTNTHQLYKRTDGSGIWEGLIPGAGQGTVYKYFISGLNGEAIEKGDPFARRWEHPPSTASIVWQSDYKWSDKQWLNKRIKTNALDQPMSVYELHLGSWQRDPADPERVLTYKEIAASLVPYIL